MANYSLVINSKFKPFSYQELLAPAMQMTQAHQAVEEAYADLQTKASVWDKMANETTDPKAHAAYQKYADDLERYALNLSRYGLNATSRKDMFDMRARYAKDITPIENAYRKREEQAKEQRVAMMNNPTLLLSRRASQTSLDDYIENPNLDYEAYSGAMLTQQVAQQAQAIAKELRSAQIEGKLDAYTNIFVQRYGVSPQAVLHAIQNPKDPNSNAILGQMVDSAIASSGIAKWGDQKTLDQARAFAVQGLWSGVGQTQAAPVENFGARKALEHKYAMEQQMQAQAAAARLEAQKAARQAAENAKGRAWQARENELNRRHELRKAREEAAAKAAANAGNVTHTTSNPVPLFTQNQLDERQKEIQKWVKKGYLIRNSRGEYGLTSAGIKENGKTTPNMEDALTYGKDSPKVRREPTAFGRFMRENHIGRNYRRSDNFSINNAIQAYLGNTGINDAYRTTGYVNKIDVDNKQALLRASNKEGLYEVEFDNNGYKKKRRVSREELASHKTASMFEIGSGMYGTTYELLDEKGNSLIVAAPGEITLPNGRKVPGGAINPTTENMKTQSLFSAAVNAAAYNSGYDLERDDSGNVLFDNYGNPRLSNRRLTDSQRMGFYDAWLDSKDNYEVYRASDIYNTKTKDSEYNPISGMR